MIIFNLNLIFLPALLLIISAANLSAAEFFKWVGKDGVVHFSDLVPDDPAMPSETLNQGEAAMGADLTKKNSEDIGTAVYEYKDSIKKIIDSTFSIKGGHNLGTGFFISSKGYAITCRHVIEDDDNHVAVLNDGSEHPIGVISLNEKHDLALILVLVREKTPFLLIGDPFTITPGDRVYAVGNSLGLQATVTDGVFTGMRENAATKDDVVQFSAPVRTGNSGGPLVDENGKAIGVVSRRITSQNGLPVSGVGFAVPSGYLSMEYGYYLD